MKSNDSTSNLFVNGGQMNYKIQEFSNELIQEVYFRIIIKNNNATYDLWLNNAQSALAQISLNLNSERVGKIVK